MGGKPGHQGSSISNESPRTTFDDYQDQFPWAIDNGLALTQPNKDILLVGGYNVDEHAYFKEYFFVDREPRQWEKVTSPTLNKPRDMAAIGKHAIRVSITVTVNISSLFTFFEKMSALCLQFDMTLEFSMFLMCMVIMYYMYLARPGRHSTDSLGWWVTGGITDEGATDSTEFIGGQLQQPQVSEVKLPYPLYGHCMVNVPETDVVLIIGGYHGRVEENLGMSSDVWAFDWKDINNVKINTPYANRCI